MPTAELSIHDNRLPQTAKVDAISVRSDVLFTNEKGEDKRPVQKRNERGLQKLMPALQRVLLPDESRTSLAVPG